MDGSVFFLLFVSIAFNLNRACNVTQECDNCDLYSSCGSHYDLIDNIQMGSQCGEACETDARCTASVWNMGVNGCYLYDTNCTKIDRVLGKRLYRKTCNEDCPRYEYFRHPETFGSSCSVAGFFADEGDCVGLCSDTTGCNSVTFRSTDSSCFLCSSYFGTPAPAEYSFWKKQCKGCEKNVTQACLNCGISTECASYFAYLYPQTITSQCLTFCNTSEDCGVGVLDHNYLRCYNYDCSRVSVKWDNVAYRKTCNADCPRFKLQRFTGMLGNCSGRYDTPVYAMTEHSCLEFCLETPTCRGVSFNNSYCTTYDCTDMVDGNDTVFYQRLCDIDCERNVTQTCLNCGASKDDCPKYFTHKTNVGISSDCMTECNSSMDCSVARYSGTISSCFSYNCTMLRLNWKMIAYRKTCNEDCPRFEIHLFAGATGNCSNILASVSSEITEAACLELCLDTPGCRGAAFDGSTNVCTVYDCGETSADTDTVFYQRLCVEECPKNNTQTCYNCQIATDCPIAYLTMPMNTDNSTSQCKQLCDQDERCHAAAYDESISRCDLVNCGQMEVAFGLVVHRKSCHNDCPRYELIRIENAKGVCDIIESLTDAWYGMTEYMCLDRCLNTPGCRGVSFTNTVCNLHNCDGHVSDGSTMFYKRVCVPECENPAQLKIMANLVPSKLRTAYILAEELVPSTFACARRCRSVDDCWGANFRPMNGDMVLCRMFVTTTDGLDLAPNTTWTYLNYDV